MEYKRFSFTSKTQTKSKNTKIQTSLQELLQRDMYFQLSIKIYILPKFLTAKIQTLEK